ncbi:MAG: SMC-Scp complex subunit ScpB [Verrucomicrobiae bacterium]|nr:SMC-Scp complex subunit ScpB [Verrucomicrobiae bacterium]
MELKPLVEAILFTAHEPLSLKEIRSVITHPDETADPEQAKALKKIKESQIVEAIDALKAEFEAQNRSFQVQEIAGSYQLLSHSTFAPWLRQMVGENIQHRLSQASLETLAIIAYRQPITRADIESIRGVNVDGVMQTLLERGLVTIAGRAEVAGRPMLYGTTRQFLEHFALKDLNELPAIEELKRIVLPTAETTPLPAQEEGASSGGAPDAAAKEPTPPQAPSESHVPANKEETAADPAEH